MKKSPYGDSARNEIKNYQHNHYHSETIDKLAQMDRTEHTSVWHFYFLRPLQYPEKFETSKRKMLIIIIADGQYYKAILSLKVGW